MSFSGIVRRGERERGVILLTVLILTVLISMFIGAAIAVGPRNLGLARSQDAALTANAAAESGIAYALMRIRQNPEWKGDGNGVILSAPDLTVVENSGYVWGHIASPDGSASMFRIRFNYEDGAGNGDGLDDGSGPTIPIPFVSVNNVGGATAKVVPRASEDSRSRVVDPAQGPYTVPAHGICLLVEGMAGAALGEFDPADPNPKGFVQTQVLESVYVVSNIDDIAKNAVAMSNSDMIATVKDGKAVKVEAKEGITPRVRSRGDLRVKHTDGSAALYESEGAVQTGTERLDADYDRTKVTVEREDGSNPFYKLAWEDLKTADPAGAKLNAGTYVWWDDGSLHYYDMNYTEYSEWIRGNVDDPGQVIFQNGSYAAGFTPPDTLSISRGKLTLTGDLYVSPVTNGAGVEVADLTVIPREGAPEEPTPEGGAGGAGAAGPALAKFLAGDADLLAAFLSAQPGDGTAPTGFKGWNTSSSSGPDADITWNPAGRKVWFHTLDYGSLEEALADAFRQEFVDASEVDRWASRYGILAADGDLELNTGDSLTADDLEIEFKPPAGQSATLSADGDVRVGAKLKGTGASLTTSGTLRVIGAGTDLAANPNAEEGVNMYAKGDVILSTLREKSDGDYEFKDIKLKGLVYTWGNFTAKLGSSETPDVKQGKLELEGTLVAYGGDPSSETPPSPDQGRIALTAREVKLVFDPSYLLSVMETLPSNIEFQRSIWTAY